MTKKTVETIYKQQTDQFAQSKTFKDFEQGKIDRAAYDAFISNVCKTHLKSPQILAFLFAVVPPLAQDDLKHNLLEELGLDGQAVAHPDLLRTLAKAAGFTQRQITNLEELAQEDMRKMLCDPIMFETIKEIGLWVLVEVVAYEWMLSRTSRKIGNALKVHRELSESDLEWFYHHSEVDIQHAEEGLESIAKYVEYYEFSTEDLESILEMTFRENIFIKRYFGEMAMARESGMLEEDF